MTTSLTRDRPCDTRGEPGDVTEEAAAASAARPGDIRVNRRFIALLAGTSIAVLGVPITVAFDSYLYVQSSRHVFGSGAFTGYHWIREPLYPLIIKVVRAIGGNADIWLIWAQLGALFLATYLASRAILGKSDRWVLATALIAAANPMALGYAGSVLQTVWITLALAAHCGLIAAAWRDPAPRVGRYVLGLLALTLIATYLAFQLSYLSLATGFALGYRLMRVSPTALVAQSRERLRHGTLVLASLAAGLALALGSVAVGVIGLQPWQAYKASVTGGAELDELGLGNNANTSPVNQMRTLAADPASAVHQMTTRPLQLLGLMTPMFRENPIFGLSPFTPEQRCGKLFWADTMPGPVEETRQLLQPTCKSRIVHAAIGLMNRPGAYLYIATSVAFLIAIPVLLVARRWEILVLGPPAILLLMYAATTAPIDRYGFPVYPIGVALLAGALRWAVRRLGRKRSGAAAQSDPTPVGSA